MAQTIRAIKGTQDILPYSSYKTEYIEKTVLEAAKSFGYKEIRTPVFEYTELFQRSVGETTDIVQKEMYTFNDRGGRSITLRPEGTAGVARALLEHGLYNDPLPQKLCYICSCYRAEKPQSGRLREHHQFGVECFGAGSPVADAAVVALASRVFSLLEVKNLSLEINSIGCRECRPSYHEALTEYFEKNKSELCETCLSRLERNPMRILDCKNPACAVIAENAPKILDFICADCREHFLSVQKYLRAMKIEFSINPTIVRGQDYYTRTVFEFVSSDIGAQGTVCGGGRYDGLVGQMGGPELPALGFGMGIERLLLLMEAQGCGFPLPETCDLYIANIGEDALCEAVILADEIRRAGFAAQCDLTGRSLKAQMKYADRIGAKFTVVIGDDEIKNGRVSIKNMATGEIDTASLESLTEEFGRILNKA